MSHANAPLTPIGRQRLAVLIVDQGWNVRRAAERFQVSPATVSKWAARYRAGEALSDRSSRPHRSPTRVSKRREHRIICLRFTRRWGPHRISYHLGIPRSTIERVLARYRMPPLRHIDQATGLPIRRPKSVPGWRIPRSSATSGRRPRPSSGNALACSLLKRASRSRPS
jgi:transcriptional regulator of acetoin/glycerol metabolism